ncbi:MAG: LptF/LptG family permease [Fusobacteriaceae bacterium]
MKKIDKHVSKNFIKYTLLSLTAFLNIYLLSQVFRIIKYVSDGKMTIGDSGIYLLTLIPKILVDITPLSVLLGGLISMNIMASNLEIISLKTSGISFKRIIIFPVILSALLSGIIFKISDTIAPNAYEKSRVLRGSDEADRVVPTIKHKAFLRGKENVVYYMEIINRVKKTGNNIQIIELSPDFNSIKKIITANKGVYDEKKEVWNLEKVYITDDINKKSVFYNNYSDKRYKDNPDEFITLGKNPKTLTIKELKKEMKDLKIIGEDIGEFTQELAKRYSFPFASFVICFIGLSLGSRYVRGSSAMSIGVSVILGYGYYVLDGAFEAISKNGFINPFISSWIPNLLFLAIGIYFLNEAEH